MSELIADLLAATGAAPWETKGNMDPECTLSLII